VRGKKNKIKKRNNEKDTQIKQRGQRNEVQGDGKRGRGNEVEGGG